MRAAFTPMQTPGRSDDLFSEKHGKVEGHERTDETDDKPTLPSRRDLSYLGPQPTERYPGVRVIMGGVHRVIKTYPSVPLDNRVLYPVCQTHGTEGSVSGFARVSSSEQLTYRCEVFIIPVSSC